MYNTIIIIPFRNREAHLKKFIETSEELFKLYLKNFKIVIIEQDEEKLFNRGKLLNVAFNLYKNNTNFFITHDVDICPNEYVVKNIYTKQNFDVVRISIPHSKSFGQICKFTHDSIYEVNGFPNYIWGWGIEDRALYYRYKILKKNISPNYTNKTNFLYLHHVSNEEKYVGEKKQISDKENKIFSSNNIKEQTDHILSSGLNNLTYTIISKIDINDNIELIKVSI
jgi:beta-1,4-galactosyltransferase 1